MKFELEPAYEAGKYEAGIYQKWEKSGKFRPKINKQKKPFTISLPPPNATGKLHLGHATMLAIEDLMIRHARMNGFETLWLPGTDHAAIATQSVVEKGLIKKGIKNPRVELGRERLLREIQKFVEESQDNIRNQMRKMGASCDWSREKYTLEAKMNKAVNTFFKYMLEDKLIYRGGRIVNWDPQMKTTVADDEVEYVEEKTKFYYFRYGPVVIATARPETKFLDKIIVVNPRDKRYKKIIGREFEIEWIEGKIMARVIADECIDMKMGTGAMTITPAHSEIDFELAQKYNLSTPQIIDFEGKIRHDVSAEFGGLDIKNAREKIVEKLTKKGLLVKVDENYIHNLALNYRGKGKIEPQIMKQWFVDVNKKVINWKGKKSSIKEVLTNVIQTKMIEIMPVRFEKTYFHWINNLKDWCISRQIWWGHQIPVFYKTDSEQYRKFNKEKLASSVNLELLKIGGEMKFSLDKPKNGYWIQDPDTLDTWFSSALWTFATLGWPQKTKELAYFHPTNVLETGYDILFFWVARMILASTYALRRDGFSEEKSLPFKKVYLHGLIRDKHGKKMSKSSPETCIDPLDMIEKYGADALRLSLIIGSSPGNDMRLYEEKIAGYRNFINKIWNASRFALLNINGKSHNNRAKSLNGKNFQEIDKWILTELQNLIKDVDSCILRARYSDAGNKIYEFLWSKYCDWYLEMSKFGSKNEEVLLFALKIMLKLLHPFTPFVTEKIWEHLSDNLLMSEKWPEFDKKLIFVKSAKNIELIQEIITRIRSLRAELKVPPAKKIAATIQSKKYFTVLKNNQKLITDLAKINNLELTEKGKKIPNSKSFFIDEIEVFLPLKDLIDGEKEFKNLTTQSGEKEKFIKNLELKLKNENFIQKAPPQIVEKEKQRLAEAKNILASLNSQIQELKLIKTLK